MTEYPVSLRELSRELGLKDPEEAILDDALDHLQNEWPLSRERLRRALSEALQRKGLVDTRPSITCPECGRTSYHPEDVKQGYCGACNWFTSSPTLGPYTPERPCPECGKPMREHRAPGDRCPTS